MTKILTFYDRQDIYQVCVSGIVIKKIIKKSILSSELQFVHFDDLPEATRLAVLDKLDRDQYGEE